MSFEQTQSHDFQYRFNCKNKSEKLSNNSEYFVFHVKAILWCIVLPLYMCTLIFVLVIMHGHFNAVQNNTYSDKCIELIRQYDLHEELPYC